MEAPSTWICPRCAVEAEFIGYTYDDGARYRCPECREEFIVPREGLVSPIGWDFLEG